MRCINIGEERVGTEGQTRYNLIVPHIVIELTGSVPKVTPVITGSYLTSLYSRPGGYRRSDPLQPDHTSHHQLVDLIGTDGQTRYNCILPRIVIESTGSDLRC
jgi:hypothetical protein